MSGLVTDRSRVSRASTHLVLLATLSISTGGRVADCFTPLAAIPLSCQMGKIQMTDPDDVTHCCSMSAPLHFHVDEKIAEELKKRPCGTKVPSEFLEIHIMHLVSAKDIFLCNPDDV